MSRVKRGFFAGEGAESVGTVVALLQLLYEGIGAEGRIARDIVEVAGPEAMMVDDCSP